jgi:hypothetical protein
MGDNFVMVWAIAATLVAACLLLAMLDAIDQRNRSKAWLDSAARERDELASKYNQLLVRWQKVVKFMSSDPKEKS